MSNTFTLEQSSKTGSLDGNSIARQYEPDLMARSMEMKTINSKLKQSELAKELVCSSSTIPRYRQNIKMLSPHRSPTSSTNRKNKSFQTVNKSSKDLNWPQMTSKEFNWFEKNPLLKRLNLGRTNWKVVQIWN